MQNKISKREQNSVVPAGWWGGEGRLACTRNMTVLFGGYLFMIIFAGQRGHGPLALYGFATGQRDR